ncbi:MAG: two-component sensor histidine kinase [Devosia sp. SCN 66-27]|nr:MAG: two-component sensor histidine kinase [Devosia sp. SCN 66-27]
MSSKRGIEAVGSPQGRSADKTASIAARLTLWYAVLSITLIVAAGSVMYWVLAERLRQEDDQLLAGRIAELRAILLLHPASSAAFQEEVKREATMLPGIQVQVRDARGELVIEAPAAHAAIFDDRHLSLSKEERGTDWRSPDGGIYRVMSAQVAVGAGFTVQVAMSRSKEEELLAAYRRTLWLAISAALLIAVAAGYLIARREMRPVSKLAALVADLNAAELHRRVGDDDWPRELKPLATNFDQLLARLEDAFARMSQFSADIAHELRTPLHILQGEAEIALTRANSSDAYRTCIESAAEEYQRLTRMVDALLFLARAEQPDAQLDKKPLQLDREIAAVCDFYQAMADEQSVDLVVQGTGQVMADAGLLRRALGNLIANALHHTPTGGQVVVEARDTPDRAAEIVVSDSGDGIAPEDLAHVFDRFYRADSARSRQGAGTGLGLAIVKFIMQLHGGTVSIQSELGRGTTVTLTFPT